MPTATVNNQPGFRHQAPLIHLRHDAIHEEMCCN